MDDDLRKLVEDVYEEILYTTNKILGNCKKFSLSVLQQENPSYNEIAEQLEDSAELIALVYNHYPDDSESYRTLVKSREYIQNVVNIAGAIRLGNEELLGEYIEDLDRRPFT